MIDVLDNIRQSLASAQSPALLCSFGADSTLLLHYARQVRRDLPVYFFGDDLPELATCLVVEDDLTIHSYAPADRYLVPGRDDLSLVAEYSFNGVRVPMVSRVTSGGQCSHGATSARTLEFYFPHDVVLWGYRHADEHPLLPEAKFAREIRIGHTTFTAPLYDLSADQVWNALDALGLDYVEDDAEEFCDDCLNAIINSDWDREAALAGFHSRFTFNH